MPHVQNPFDAQRYVKENSYSLAIKDYSNIGLALLCIDDRSSDSEDRTRDIAIPGAGLGLVMDALGAFTLDYGHLCLYAERRRLLSYRGEGGRRYG